MEETAVETTEGAQGDIAKLIGLAERLSNLKGTKAELEQDLKTANKAIETTEAELLKMMTDNEIERFDHAGNLFYPYVSSFPKVLDQDGFYDWLRNHGEDGIIKETIHPQTLRSWYSQHDEWSEELLSNKFVEAFEKVRIGIRKGK